MVFQELYGPARIVFRADEQGRVTHMFFSDLAAIAFVRRGFFETSAFSWRLVGLCAVMFGSALVFWPAIAYCTNQLGSPFRRWDGAARVSLLGWLMSAICLGFVVSMMVALDESDELAFGMPRHLQYLLLVPQVCTVLAALVLIGSIIAWRRRYWRFSGRLHCTLVALAGGAFVWFLFYSNLLTFGLAAMAS